MTFAAESKKSGREPCVICELDLDSCPRVNGSATHEDEIASFNDNLAAFSGELDDPAWTKSRASISADAVNDPDGVLTADEIIEDNTAGVHETFQGLLSADGASVYTLFARLKANTRTKARVYIGGAGFAGTPRAEFDLTLGTMTSSADVASAGIVSLGGGWYTCWLKAISNAAVSTEIVSVALLNAIGTLSYLGDGTSGLYCGGVQFEKTSTLNEYQATAVLDGSETNVTLVTGGLAIDANVGDDAVAGDVEGALTGYAVVDNGVGWLRVTGDATGEGTGVALAIAPDAATACRASPAAGLECYNTRATCQSTIDYLADVKTYSFSQPRPWIPASTGIIPSIRGYSLTPTRIGLREGLAARASARITFADHPHHDRGIDPYVATRLYDPIDQGTYWGRLRARTPFYQGRLMRVKIGYRGSGFDLVNNFETHLFEIETISGPDSQWRVVVTGKDILKLADDDRAQAPRPNSGVLLAAIDDAVTSATLSPAGIGDADYAASGTIRIGSETATFTRVADVLTIVRGTDGTTAEEHNANDSVQESLRITDATVDAVVEDLLVRFAGIPPAYIPSADWAEEVEDGLGGSLVNALITEPTGVAALLKEIASAYMLYLWWDSRDQEIKLEVIFPYFDAPPVLTDAANLLADSVRVTDSPKDRRSQIWVYSDRIDPTEPVTEARNYRLLYIKADLVAESPLEYGDSRVETIFSRWFTSRVDSVRLAGRLLGRLGDTPRTIAFSLDMKDSGFDTGSLAALETRCIQGPDGAPLNTPVRILEARETDGHSLALVAADEGFTGRYGRWGPDPLPDYDGATEEERRKYFWIAAESDDPDDALNGDGAYKIA